MNLSRFDTIDYLKSGNAKQQKLHSVLVENLIFEYLADFSPFLTGTIPIEVDIDESDADIACCWESKSAFKAVLQKFSRFKSFDLSEKEIKDQETLIARFRAGDFQFEIFGQNRPVKEQESYLHMIKEFQILQKKGEDFRKEIIRLKTEGFKTEPAFAKALGLTGDPYKELLKVQGFA